MNVLVACEESQRVCIAFREKGHNAFSCDIQDCSGGHPEWHIKDNVLNVINDKWDILIGFPPCTYFSRMNFLNYYRNGVFNKKRFYDAKPYINLFFALWNADIPRICLENPVPFKLFKDILPPYTMSFQPYEFGADYSKKTCLWLKNLPPLLPTTPYGKKNRTLITTSNSFSEFKSIKEQSIQRSKTFPGVAQAMSEQWGKLK